MKGLHAKDGKFKKNLADKICPICGISFHPRTAKRKVCSTKCKSERLSKLFDKKVVVDCVSCKKPLALKICRIKGSDKLFCNSRCYGDWMEKTGIMKGEKCHFWKGGTTSKNMLIRSSSKYKRWRQKVFERDDWTCQECGIRGVPIHADHKKSFALYPELRFELSNGRTLCVPCHKKTDSYLKNNKKTLCHILS